VVERLTAPTSLAVGGGTFTDGEDAGPSFDMLAAFPADHGRKQVLRAIAIIAVLVLAAIIAGLAGSGALRPAATVLPQNGKEVTLSAGDAAALNAFLSSIESRVGKDYEAPAPTEPSFLTDEPPVLQLRQTTPEEAFRANAAIPISKAPNPPAPPFYLAETDPAAKERSVDCLTAAIHYEAASEGAVGQRAVAQVVLNRLRHAAYPKTVCGVVFEGSGRTTGCQFTFTCDGSLARKPNPAAWSRAKAVAEAALAGSVMPYVGLATHYHTVYVTPYWTPTLVKVARIGLHIFYRWQGLSALGAGPGTTTAPLEPVGEAPPPAPPALPTAEAAPTAAPAALLTSPPAQPAPAATTPASEPEKKPADRPSRVRVRSLATPDGW
jgi:spore germination cell wall hydrolase CwlJ-like protein